MAIITVEMLEETARSLAPELRADAEEGERTGRLPDRSLRALREAGFHRLFVPRTYGGLEIDPLTHARVQEEISAADSAAGWSLMVAGSAAWWTSRLAAEGADEIFAGGPDLLGAVAFNPPVDARRVEGGYRLTGRRAFASCSHAAGWMWMTAIVDGGNGAAPEVIGAFFPAREARIDDTWDALGMRGTDSNDIAVDDLFVPASRAFPIPPTPATNPAFDGALYRAPVMLTVAAYLPPVALGIARQAIAELRAIAAGKTPLASATVLRDRAEAQAAVGKAEAILRSARALLHATIAEAWERTVAGVEATLDQKGDLLMAGTHTVQASAKVAAMMYEAAGTTGVYKRSPLERHFRDAHVVKQHGFLSASRYATVGQIRMGVEPDLGFVHF